MEQEQLLSRDILEKKAQQGIYIIAHYYQRDEIQNIADFIGDSYSMALAARDSESDIILVAGVDFMAETAAILCPGKTILSPEPAATCPMANSVSARQIREFKEQFPDSLIVTYVNTPAEVKAVSDVCCTSSNAETIIRKLPEEQQIYFVPDENLALNVSKKLDRDIKAYPSCCPIHDQVTTAGIKALKEQFPEALVLVHPECKPEVVELADYAGSTGGILEYASNSDVRDFIIGTECGILHPIFKACPDKNLVLASPELICPNMKSITLEKILQSIDKKETVVTVPEEIRENAFKALERMIALTD